jgi:hypothetical protein
MSAVSYGEIDGKKVRYIYSVQKRTYSCSLVDGDGGPVVFGANKNEIKIKFRKAMQLYNEIRISKLN